jgi:type IV pilus assembly protein PilQ
MKKTIIKLLQIFLVILMTLPQISCTSFGDGEDTSAPDTEQTKDTADSALDNEDTSAVDAEEPAEQTEEAPKDDISSEFADEETPESSEVAEQPEDNVPAPEIADEAPATPAEPETPAYEDELSAASSHVRVTGLDYKANENGGTIVIQTSAPAKFKTEENSANNQYIIEIENAELPSQFQRPYNTKEFSGVVGMINAYQKPGTDRVRVIVQLKKSTPVSVVQEGNSLVVVPGAAVASTPEPEVTPQPEEKSSQQASASDDGESLEKHTALNSKTLDEFLMGDSKFYGKKISIEIIDGEIRDVINFISEESGVNLVLSDEIKGKISVKLRQIPWDQALVVIMQTKQLGYIRQGNILRISTLMSIRAETDSAKQLLDAQKQLEPLKVKVFPISYAKAKDLEAQALGFLSTRGTAKADDRTNNLVVRDIAENVTKIEKLLTRLDTQTPQVYIEGKIVESKTGAARDLGVNWSDNSSGAVNLSLASGVFTGSGNLSLTAKLALLESDEKVKVLSSPRIVTLDNQQANIEQSTQFPTYLVSINPDTNVKSTTIEYKTVKLSLNVTPQITSDGGVILKTEILREFAGAVDLIAPETGARSLNSRSAKSTILVENGNTAVLGGIYSTDNTEGNAGIPLLRKIPFIGWLFGQDKMTYDKNELLIFLTPRVINKDKDFTNKIRDGTETDTL